MRPPVTVWMLVIVLVVLALGGLAGAYGFLSDPTGVGMGMDALLTRLPVSDYILPGLFLLLVMFAFPLTIVYGLLARPRWRPLDPLVGWTKSHWSWAASLLLGIGLALWLAIQALLIGFSAPIQWFTALLDALILATTITVSTRSYYAIE